MIHPSPDLRLRRFFPRFLAGLLSERRIALQKDKTCSAEVTLKVAALGRLLDVLPRQKGRFHCSRKPYIFFGRDLMRKICTFCLVACSSAMILAAISSTLFGAKPPKDDPPPPETPLPPIVYLSQDFNPPTATVRSILNDMNNGGECVGNYDTPEGERHAWLFDPFIDADTAVDLNDIGAVGVPEGWVIASAVGINDLGAIVGYLTHLGNLNVRRGYVLDLSTNPPVLGLLPDQDPTWVIAIASKINENGDVYGAFQRNDGTWGTYLFNPGLYGPTDLVPEVIDENVFSIYGDGNLNNPSANVPTQVVGTFNNITPGAPYGFLYTRGIGIGFPYDDQRLLNLRINDAGTICGTVVEEVQVRKKMTATTYFLFRDSGSGITVLPNSEGKSTPWAINSQGTILAEGSAGDFLYHDDWGFVHIDALVTGGLPAEHGTLKLNDNGPLGFGQLAGLNESSGVFFILTPVVLP